MATGAIAGLTPVILPPTAHRLTTVRKRNGPIV